MRNARNVWIGVLLVGAALLCGVAVWHDQTRPAPASLESATSHPAPPVRLLRPTVRTEPPPDVRQVVSAEISAPNAAPNLGGIKLSEGALARLETPEVPRQDDAIGELDFVVQLPVELAGVEASLWLDSPHDETLSSPSARVRSDGLAAFELDWTGPRVPVLVNETWVGGTVEVQGAAPSGYFDARPYVNVAQIAIRVPPGSEVPRSMRMLRREPGLTFVQEFQLRTPGDVLFVSFAPEEVNLVLSAVGYRTQEVTIRPGHQVLELKPGIVVRVQIEGVDPATLQKGLRLRFQRSKELITLPLYVDAPTTEFVFPRPGQWDVAVREPSALARASKGPRPVWSTTVHVDEVDATVTLRPVWTRE